MLSSSAIGQLLSAQRQQVSSAPAGSQPQPQLQQQQFLRSSLGAQPQPPVSDAFGLRRDDSSKAFAEEHHKRVMQEHQRLASAVSDDMGARNPYLPSQPSTGMAAADEQIAQLHRAREEMRKRLLNIK